MINSLVVIAIGLVIVTIVTVGIIFRLRKENISLNNKLADVQMELAKWKPAPKVNDNEDYW